MRRVTLALVFAFTASLLAAWFVQLLTDRAAENEIRRFIEQQGLTATGSLRYDRKPLGAAAMDLELEAVDVPLQARLQKGQVTTALLRRDCRKSYTVGLMPALRFERVNIAFKDLRLTLSDVCIDSDPDWYLDFVAIDEVRIVTTNPKKRVGTFALERLQLSLKNGRALNLVTDLRTDFSRLADCLGSHAGAEMPRLQYQLDLEGDATPGSLIASVREELVRSSGESFATRLIDLLSAMLLRSDWRQRLETRIGDEPVWVELSLTPGLWRGGDGNPAVGFDLKAPVSELSDQCASVLDLVRELQRQGMGCNGPALVWNLEHSDGVRLNCARLKDDTTTLRHPPPGSIVHYMPACGDQDGVCPYDIAIVEFGDNGKLLEPRQQDALFRLIDRAPARDVILVAFVHGWNESAEADTKSLKAFQELMAAIANMEILSKNLSGRQVRAVVGVYIGWNGRMYRSNAANYLTSFWNRLEVADRLGKPRGDLQRLLLSLGERVKERNKSRQRPIVEKSTLVVAGHSMGGRAVFGATRAALEAELTDKGDAPYFGDLVLLINPAFSAYQYRVIHNAFRQVESSSTPLLLFSSVADHVTRALYPLGQTLGFSSRHDQDVTLREFTTTAPNFEDFVTHRLRLHVVRAGNEDILEAKSGIVRGFLRIPQAESREEFTNYVHGRIFRQPSASQAYPDPEDVWYEMVLCRHQPLVDDVDDDCPEPMTKPTQFPPAMVVQVDRAIIPDHGRIFTAPFMEYVLRMVNARLAKR